EGLLFPNFRNSNIELAKQLAKGTGSMIGRHKKKRFFLVIDALGYDLLLRALDKSKVLRDAFSLASIEKISTVFPSFTPTVFTSIDSGLTPAEHGIVGSPLPIKEYGTFQDVFSLRWWPSSEEFKGESNAPPIFPSPKTVLQMAQNRGFCYLQDEDIIKKNKDSDAFKRIKSFAYISPDDFIIQAKSLLKEYSLVYAYQGYVDHAQHIYTKDTDHGFEVIVWGLERLAEKLVPYLKEQGWELVITSDHGQISTSKKDFTVLNSKSKLIRYLSAPPWGTESLNFFQVNEADSAKFEKQFESTCGKKFLLYDSEEAIKSGLFGKARIKEGLRYRFGTHVAVSKGRWQLKYLKPGVQLPEFKIHGHHGGLTKEEMEIPLLIL
ncbi:MAG: alkaline phosphatase family protein, partial [Candidatus Micrarchaeaceae archaeon]